MADEGFKRKLTSILSADAVGYSRLMEDDEEATLRTLTSYREVIATLIKQHNGMVVDSPGDNLLAEFVSVVDAVQCAVSVQNEINARNEDLPQNRKMEFRIGINLGDVIQEGERIYGDGVNIAARLEALAEPGGICVSKTAFDQIERKLPYGYEFIGDQTVKNISKPVGAYRVMLEPRVTVAGEPEKEKRAPVKRMPIFLGAAAVLVLAIAVGIWQLYIRRPSFEPASIEKMAFPLPDKPSIAVLPFDNMSEDPKQEYFSDGLTDQIISGLSKVPNIFVIARNSTFTYKGKPVKVQKVAEDLGVRYVMEGSVQRTADRIRVTAQLIDAINGHHVWSERYDREPKDIFAIQDDITLKIMKAMRIELSEGEAARQWVEKVPNNLEVFEKMLQARKYAYKYGKADNARARQLFEEVIALDPDYAAAYAGVGFCLFCAARFGFSESPAESIKTAFKYTHKAIALDDTLDFGHFTLAALYVVTRQYEKALAEGERAVALNPNGADALSALAGTVGCMGRWQESITLAKKSIRLNPFPLPSYYHWLGRAYFMTAQYDDAIITFKKALNVNPNYLPAYAFLAACYSSLDRQAEAEDAAAEVLRINPEFNLESYAKTLPYKNKTDIERYVAALRKAGLPE